MDLTKYFIVTAAHVLASEQLVIEGPNGVKEEVEADEFEQAEPDIAYVQIKPNVVTRMDLRPAKLMPLKDRTSVFAAGIRSLRSNGFLKDVETDFSLLEYEGSTVAGFSGCPYFVNRHVYGMHQHTVSGHNYGVPATYIQMVLMKHLRYKNEDTAEYLIGVLKSKKGKAKYIVGHGVELKADGHYRFIEEDSEIYIKILPHVRANMQLEECATHYDDSKNSSRAAQPHVNVYMGGQSSKQVSNVQNPSC